MSEVDPECRHFWVTFRCKKVKRRHQKSWSASYQQHRLSQCFPVALQKLTAADGTGQGERKHFMGLFLYFLSVLCLRSSRPRSCYLVKKVPSCKIPTWTWLWSSSRTKHWSNVNRRAFSAIFIFFFTRVTKELSEMCLGEMRNLAPACLNGLKRSISRRWHFSCSRSVCGAAE